jgi:hypothetical protein
VLAEAIGWEGTTFRDCRMVNGESGRNAGFLIAYSQAGSPCLRCATSLCKVSLGGRGTTFCPACRRHWQAARNLPKRVDADKFLELAAGTEGGISCRRRPVTS